jgi:hypothetical protein
MPYQVGVNLLGTKAYHLAHSEVIVAIIIEESSTIYLDESMCEFLKGPNWLERVNSLI